MRPGLVVAGDVLPVVGELQGRAGGVREAQSLRVGVAEEGEDHFADGVGGVVAVGEEVGEGLVARLALVDAVGFDEAAEGVWGERGVPRDFGQGDGNGVPGGATRGEGPVGLPLPGVEQVEAVRARLAGLVAEIVGEAAEGVDRVHGGPQGGGEEARDDGEVLVATARVALAPARRGVGRGGEVECGLDGIRGARGGCAGDHLGALHSGPGAGPAVVLLGNGS